MIYVFLAPGFEESEAIVPLDILRRAGVDARTVGVSARNIAGAHGISVKCDLVLREAVTDGLEMIVLPGGMPGTANLRKNVAVGHYIDYAFEHALYIGAICAAPSVIGARGHLAGRRVACYPGYEDECLGAEVTGSPLEVDGNLVTANGAGAALEFGLKLAETLRGAGEAQRIRAAMLCR